MNWQNDSELQKILNDNYSGSQKLLSDFNNWLILHLNDIADISLLIKFISNKFPSFENFKNYLKTIKEIWEEKSILEVESYCNEFPTQLIISNEKLISNAVDKLKKFHMFITISNSSSVNNVLVELNNSIKNLEVFVCESRPVNEGQLAAKYLLRHNIKTHLITESAIAYFAEKVDACILGADKILPNGNVVNKMGSKLLAIASKYYSKPCYVIADKLKYSENNTFEPVIQNPKEIWDFTHGQLVISNLYFELIDKNLITTVISD